MAHLTIYTPRASRRRNHREMKQLTDNVSVALFIGLLFVIGIAGKISLATWGA